MCLSTVVTINQGKSDSHVEEYGDQNKMAGNPLERKEEVLQEDAGKTKTSRSGQEEAVLVFLNYKLNAVWRLLWEKGLQHSSEEGPQQLKKSCESTIF